MSGKMTQTGKSANPDIAAGPGKTAGPLDLYRITKERYAEDLSGTGARRYGGRWNNRGVPVVYAAEHRSLSLLEFLVHAPPQVMPAGMCMLAIRIPEGVPVRDLTTADLPAGWRGYPYDSLTQEIGDALLKSGKYGLIRVPSAIVQEEWNCLIHPGLAQESGVFVREIKPLYLDGRLLPDQR